MKLYLKTILYGFFAFGFSSILFQLLTRITEGYFYNPLNLSDEFIAAMFVGSIIIALFIMSLVYITGKDKLSNVKVEQ